MGFQETVEDRLALFKADAEIPFEEESLLVASDDNPAREGTIAQRRQVHEKLFSLPVRDNALNPMLGASGSLLALALRLHSLTDAPDVDKLHRRLINEVESSELELTRLGYDRVTVLAQRYCLCAFLDETVMAHEWGMEANWADRSLLSTFHEETWAGDKFFIILDRMLMEPKRYLHLLEFLYTCLCLGYEGKHGTYSGDAALLEKVIRETRDVLRKEKGQREPLSLAYTENAANVSHRIKWQTPLAAVVGATALTACLIYAGFFLYLDRHIDRTLIEITEMLGKE